MIVTLIVVCEVGFWVLLAAGLAARYLLRMPRLGLGLLLCEPLLEVLLLVVTAVDLKDGAEPSWRHGLAAVYIGYTVGHGHRTVKWLDGIAAHRFGGAPPPPKPPRYGKGRALHEGAIWLGTVVAAVVATGLLTAAIWYVGDAGDTSSLRGWINGVWKAVGIHGLIALSYALFPKSGPEPQAEDRSPLPARDPEDVPDRLVGRAREDAASPGGDPRTPGSGRQAP
ncbi:hypothetical protein ACFY9F_16305 [Streptomyces sp. NPDC012421]|uniref:hypothetical protein n=1 Tax=Streptomyces sp. NPDC012421 TaxID=3364832 RepID=UPI0036E9820B